MSHDLIGELSQLIAETDDWSVSTDKKGRNAGRPTRVRRWIGDAA